LNGESSVTIRRITTFNLNTDLGCFAFLQPMPGIGMNANQIITLVFWRRFISQDVPTHEITHDKIFSTRGDNGETKNLFLGYAFLRSFME
jgi:hypothetical protein